MVATLSFALVGVLGGRLQEGNGGGLARVEPGLQWVYDGTLSVGTTTEREDRREFKVRLHYLALEKFGDRSVRVALVQKVDPVAGAAGGEKRRPEEAEGTVFTELGPSLLRPKPYGAFWFKRANLFLYLAPFPPRDVSATAGEWRVPNRLFETLPSRSNLTGDQVWTTEPEEGGVRITCAPASPPISRGEFNPTTLEAYRQTYIVDRAEGLVKAFERSWRVRSTEEIEDAAITLRLVESKEMTPDELRTRTAEADWITTTEMMVATEEDDLDALVKRVETALPRFAGSPLRAAAEDLRGEIDRKIDRLKKDRAWWEEDRKTGERLLGKAAPEFTGRDLEGNEVSLPRLRGKVVLLNFWASW
ncbi:MAG TPA: redoxin domain-containing protein [Planctomycetota bacterium]|jgi:hypothetical protein|nr:redoxin domain-containing protein [Planctomycetota bacterium]